MTTGRALDIGCGPGCWCIDFCQTCPRMQVIGIDNGDMFPDPALLPRNCELIQHNVLEGLGIFDDASFDYIHIRFMSLSFTHEQYTKLIRDCWRVLKPGGYVEIMEMDMMVYSPGPTTEKLNQEGKELKKLCHARS